MKKIVKIFLAVILCLALAHEFASSRDHSGRKLVLINKFVDHPALDETVRGIIEGLENGGFVRGKTVDVKIESAQANPALASQISSKFANQYPDLMICVGTISAQSALKYANDGRTKMIFSSITDPIGAGLVKKLDKINGNVTGVSNFVPIEPQLELMKKIQPSVRRLGVVYNVGEINSVSAIERLQAVASRFDLTVIKQGVTKTSEISQAVTKLVSRVDAIFINNDNTALSCLPGIVSICNANTIPIYISDTDAVFLGALAALGPNQYSIGNQTGKMAARIMGGVDISTIPVEFPEKMELFINMDAAKILKINVPPDVVAEATEVIGE
jgi:putative ABC transport system substrate-binding protein